MNEKNAFPREPDRFYSGMHGRVPPAHGRRDQRTIQKENKKSKHSLFRVRRDTEGNKSPHASRAGACRARETFFHAFRKGSLTVEAAAAAPLFIFCVITLICMTDMYGLYVRQLLRLQVRAEQTGAEAATGSVIEITEPVEWDMPVFGPFTARVKIACRARVRPWTGRDPERNGSGDPDEGRMVYVTEHGQVYHTSAACTHIDLSVQAVSGSALPELRNADGGRYHACEKCVGSGQTGGIVFITEDGDCYHNSAACSGLKRTVHLVPISETGGLHICSRCQVLEGE